MNILLLFIIILNLITIWFLVYKKERCELNKETYYPKDLRAAYATTEEINQLSRYRPTDFLPSVNHP